MPSCRRVGIIGSTGQLGTDLVQVFEETGRYEVHPLPHASVDVTDSHQIGRALEDSRLDVVINCAAFHRVDECEEKIGESFRINAQGAWEVARACQAHGALCVYISTDYVFSGDKGSPYTENDRTAPVNVYGVSKVAGELLVQEACAQSLILRISSVFGKAGARGKGGNFIEAILAKARAGGPVRVVNDQWMSPTYTRDAAQVLERLIQDMAVGVYHAANSGRCNWFEFAQEALRSVGLAVEVEPIPAASLTSRARRPADSSLTSIRLPAPPAWPDALRAYLREKGYLTV